MPRKNPNLDPGLERHRDNDIHPLAIYYIEADEAYQEAAAKRKTAKLALVAGVRGDEQAFDAHLLVDLGSFQYLFRVFSQGIAVVVVGAADGGADRDGNLGGIAARGYGLLFQVVHAPGQDLG